MKIKLIGIDFDGTLLNDKKEIPALNVEMIKRATEKGVLIALTTGRPINDVTQGYHRQLGIFKPGHPFIAYNGAAVMDIKNGDFIIKHELGLSEVKEIFAHAEKYNAVCYAYRNDALLYNFLNDYIWEEKIFNDTVFKPIDLDALTDDFKCFKVMFAESPELLDRMEKEMPEELKKQTFNHLGGCTYFEGKIYVAVEDMFRKHPCIAVFDADTLTFTGEYKILDFLQQNNRSCRR